MVSQSDVQDAIFDISGMTCASCEEHVKHAVNVARYSGNYCQL